MPFATHNGVRLYWKLDGASDRPPLVLLHSIGTDSSVWDAAMPSLLSNYRVLRMDIRGHGASDAPEANYGLSGLAADVLAVMRAAGIESAVIAGVSLGGMIAMELAVASPKSVAGLVLICTSAAIDPSSWQERIDKVRGSGMAAIADVAMSRFLDPKFAQSNPSISQSLRRGLLNMSADGYMGAGAAIRDMNLIPRIPSISAPTLILAGTKDVSTPLAGHGDRIAAAIPGAQCVVIDSAHLAPIEAPAAVAAAIRCFAAPAGSDSAKQALFDAGLLNRRRVLGDEWVDKALAGRTAFTADYQEMITRIAWQEIWSRPGLDDRTRRLLVIAMTAALGRWEEFRLHVRSGLQRGGFTREDLKEVLMQTAIYAGVPAANTGFAEAGEIIAQLEKTQHPSA